MQSCLALRTAGPQTPKRPVLRTRRLCTAIRAINGQPGPLELPGGATWWPGAAAATAADAVLYGGANGSFIINRPSLRVGQQGLVVRGPQPKPQRYVPKAPPAAAGALVLHQRPAGGLVLPLCDIAAGAVVIDTDYEVVAAEAEVSPNNSCLSIVPWGLPEAAPADDDITDGSAQPIGSGKHPRRTLLLRFSCNLCGTSNTNLVNPHAWHNGSVFCKCSGCKAVHKLKDNLEIFREETSDGVFPPRELRDTLLAPDVVQALKRFQHDNRN